MKFLDRLALAVFSIIIFVLAVLLCLLMLGWFDVELVESALQYLKSNEIATNITIGVSVVLLLLALKLMFFDSYSREKEQSREGILLENDNGKLLVSRDTLENLTTSVAKEIGSIENVVSRVILDKENNLIIFVNLFVKAEAIIKDVSSSLQEKIKLTVKDSLGLDVKEVNIKIKNITDEKKTVPQEKEVKQEKEIKELK